MYIVKILKRKDAASVIVAVVLGFILIGTLPSVTNDLATYLAGITGTPNLEWREFVAKPLISAFLQVVVLEAVLRVVIYIRPLFVRRVTKSSKK